MSSSGWEVTIFLKSWKSTLTYPIVSFKFNGGQPFVCVEVGAEEIQKLFVFCRTVSENCNSILFSLFEAKSSHRKSYDTLFRENKGKKKIKFYSYDITFCHVNQAHFWISPKLLSNFKKKRVRQNCCKKNKNEWNFFNQCSS